MWSKSTGLPNIMASRRMLRDQSIRDFRHLALQCALQSGFDDAGNKTGENLAGNLPKDFFGTFAGQPLHKGIEKLVAKLGVVKDDALSRPFDNFAIDLDRLAKSSFV